MSSSYKLIDSGDYEKLEIIGGYKLIRPALGSPYKKTRVADNGSFTARFLKVFRLN
jgi:hypothetical protein